MKPWIGLLDCNNFFVSCERLFRPDLHGKPVVVLSSNDGCVVARSQEIKDMGIPMGVPYFQVKDILKDNNSIIFSSHFALYRDISRRVFEVMKTELDVVEQYSIDEAFFLIEGTEAAVLEKMNYLKQLVEQQVGIPVSLGVAASKTQAKYANQIAKKTTGITILSKSEWERRIEAIPLTDLWGVGLKSALAFKKHGLITVKDILVLEERYVKAQFGVVGVRLCNELRGVPNELVSRRLPQQSILHSRSFKQTTKDHAVLQDAVAYHVREAAADLRSMGLKTLSLQVSLGAARHSDYVLQSGRTTIQFVAPTDDTFALLTAAADLVDFLYKPGVPYKKAGISLFNLTPGTVSQLSAFSDCRTEKTKIILDAVDAHNRQSSRGKILIGSRLKTEQWESSRALRSPAYTTQWSDIAHAKT